MNSFDSLSGKIDNNQFKGIVYPRLGKERLEVISGPQFGVDTALIDLGNDRVLAISSDPLSLIPALGLKESAWLSVHLLANDMATTGFAPQYGQFVLNLPVELSSEDFKTYWQYIHLFCEEAGIAITGGHTGKIPGQNATISGGGTMFLTASKPKVLSSDKAKDGDAIVITKSAGLAASSILAKSFPEKVKAELGENLYKVACENFYQTSGLKEALLAAKTLKPNAELNALHDVTEGGVLGAISEMSLASGLGFEIDKHKIPVKEEIQSIGKLFEIDPCYCVGAGSMVMSVQPDQTELLIHTLKTEGIRAAVVGYFHEKEKGCKTHENETTSDFVHPQSDPYWAAFFNALNRGWK